MSNHFLCIDSTSQQKKQYKSTKPQLRSLNIKISSQRQHYLTLKNKQFISNVRNKSVSLLCQKKLKERIFEIVEHHQTIQNTNINKCVEKCNNFQKYNRYMQFKIIKKYKLKDKLAPANLLNSASLDKSIFSPPLILPLNSIPITHKLDQTSSYSPRQPQKTKLNLTLTKAICLKSKTQQKQAILSQKQLQKSLRQSCFIKVCSIKKKQNLIRPIKKYKYENQNIPEIKHYQTQSFQIPKYKYSKNSYKGQNKNQEGYQPWQLQQNQSFVDLY